MATKSKKAKKVYVQDNGPVVVCKGASRKLSVAKDHPAALAIELNKKAGGSSEITGYGVRLADKDGLVFAVIKGVTGEKTAFCVYHTTVKSAKERYETLANVMRQDRKGKDEVLVDEITRERMNESMLNKLHTLATEGLAAKLKARSDRKAARAAKKAPKAKKAAPRKAAKKAAAPAPAAQETEAPATAAAAS